MSRVQAVGLGLVLLCGVTWIAVAVDALPLARLINAGVEASADGSGAADDFADAIGSIFLFLVLAAGIGVAIGALLRGQSARAREAELQRRLLDTKGRIPHLETGLRNREMQVARVELEMKELGERMVPLNRTIDEGEYELRDRDRTIATLRHELSELKATAPTSDGGAAGYADLDFGDYRDAVNAGDTQHEELEARLQELEAEVHARQARITELMNEQHKHAARTVELEAALDAQRKRSEAFDRERHRQDKWLDVLNDQLAHARDANEGLNAELTGQRGVQSRVDQLEAERKQLLDEVSDRERRLMASRFECATARTTIAHLQAQLARSGAGGDR